MCGKKAKLLRSNISGNMYKWIESYLFQRTARVKINGHSSHLVKIKEGVPQGGVISPTLFIIFINDIVDKLTTHISRALHADDLAVWTASEYITTATYRMQQTLNSIQNWSKEWLVSINKTKTETTCFSLSPKKEKFTLKLEDAEVPQQDIPTYLGVKLDRTLTWKPQIANMENRALRKMAIMKKIAGTRWGANKKVLRQVYTSTVRPHVEYASTSWTTAAKTNTTRLNKIQNASLRIITGGMKTTPIAAMEKTTGLHSLEERREEKLLRQTEKLKRLPSHPLYQKLQEPTKNRLKRQSINHSSKALQRKIQDVLPQNQQGIETLKDYEEWMTSNFDIRLELPSVKRKEDHSEPALKALTLETIYQQYPTNSWAHVYTDGSAEEAVRNGGGGVLMLFPDGTRSSKAVPTGKVSTNFRAVLRPS